jgi:hypothetical protein
MSASGLGCVKTRRGITTPGILSPVVMRRAKKHKNASSARHYDQIRFRFHTAWVKSVMASVRQLLPQFTQLQTFRRAAPSAASGQKATSLRLIIGFRW